MPRIPPRSRMPRGVAQEDYSRPCPGCQKAPRKGDQVVKVEFDGRSSWWHENCRNVRLAYLRTPNH